MAALESKKILDRSGKLVVVWDEYTANIDEKPYQRSQKL
jgi:hypothetical protein